MYRFWLLIFLLPVAVIGETKTAEELKTYFADAVKEHHFSGAVLVRRNDEVLLYSSYGYADQENKTPNLIETEFQIGSITKQFTAMAVLLLQDDGKLNVTDTIGTHVEGLPEHWQTLTIHQLLSHTSGLPHSWAVKKFFDEVSQVKSLDETLATLHHAPLVAPPGTKFQYSGTAYFLLAKLVEVKSGMSYHEFLHKRIFEPLQMVHSGGDHTPTDSPLRAKGYQVEDGALEPAVKIHVPQLTGGGDLYSSISDLDKWSKALTERKLLSEAGYQQMYTPVMDNYGYGWNVDEYQGSTRYYHGGSVPGFRALIVRIPSRGITYIFLANAEIQNFGQLFGDVLKILD